jgi:hypothetical protein
LISWWRAEGDATDAVGLNNGTLQGAVTFASGEVGQGFSFNGINTAVQVPDSPSLDFVSNTPMSIELWAYRTGEETTMYLIGKQNADCGSLQYAMGFNPYTGLAFDAGYGSVATGIQMPLNTWMHLAATFDGTNTFEFFTNGALAATGSGNLGPSNSAPLIIGNTSICGGFAGLIDEVSIYNSALSAAAIQSIYAAGSSGKCFSPPIITNQPQSQSVLSGVTVSFSVGVCGGTPPYSYQWQLNATNISGATTNPLVLTNVQSSAAGSYSVVVRGVGASVTSSNALLTVVTPVPGEVVVLDQAHLLTALAAGGHVTFGGDGTIVLSETLIISQNTIVDGSGHSVTISGNDSVRVFSVNSGVNFTLKNLTIANGFNAGSPGAGGSAGGLYNNGGTVNVVQGDFVGNATVGGAGGNGGDASGGAIYNNLGFLNITNTFFVSNSATGGAIGTGGTVGGNSLGGAIFNNGGTVNLAGSTFLFNSSLGGYGATNLSGSAFGAAVHNAGGILNVIGSTFTGNYSSSGLVLEVGGVGGSSLGGAMSILAGNVSVNNSSFYNNNAVSPAVGGSGAGCATAGQALGGGIYQGSGVLNLVATTLATNCVVGGSGSSVIWDSTYEDMTDIYDSGANAYGAGLFNAGTLNSTNCTFYGNIALGGGATNRATVYGTNAYGGAIFNQGTANVIDTTLSGNSAIGGVGGYTETPDLYYFGIASGTGNGGGIFNSNLLLLVGCTISDNTAVGQAAPAIFENFGEFGSIEIGYPGAGSSSYGGGIYNCGVCFATNDTFFGNSATGGAGASASGGGLFSEGGSVTLDYVTISSNSANGSPGMGGGICNNGGTVTSDYVTISANSANGSPGMGGGICNNGGTVTSDYVTISANSANGSPAVGGGICNNAGTVTLDTLTVSSNSANGSPATGGGVFNSNVMSLIGCTISDNTAVGSWVGGGGVCNLGVLFATNDTLFGNSAENGSPASGGGLFNQGGTVTLDYVTICSNSANGSPGVGGGINATNGSLLLLDSIVANNPSGSDFYGSFGAITDGGDNISSDISFPFRATGSMNNTNPKLGLLGNYGGPTQTVPLLAGSPAIDAAGAGGCPATDQRGVSRPNGLACDIGAFEYTPSFSIEGQVQSLGPTGIITVSAGIWSSVTDSEGNYGLNDVVDGSYLVTPSSSIPGVHFIPANQTITTCSGATDVNFVAYLANSLTMEGYSNGVMQLAFAGTSGQTAVVEMSTNLINWVPVSTNFADTNGLLLFGVTNSIEQPMLFIRTRTP